MVTYYKRCATEVSALVAPVTFGNWGRDHAKVAPSVPFIPLPGLSPHIIYL